MQFLRGGVRPSNLPFALEPKPGDDTLSYDDVENVDYLDICPWVSSLAGAIIGLISQCSSASFTSSASFKGEEEGTFTDQTEGYTTFADRNLVITRANTSPVKAWCRKPEVNCLSSAATCMVSTCTDQQVLSGGYTRIELKVAALSSPSCKATFDSDRLEVALQCNLRDTTGFGYSNPYIEGETWHFDNSLF